MAQRDQERPELKLSEHVEQFYRQKAQQEGRDFSEEISIALQEHMDMLQAQAHKPVPGQDKVKDNPCDNIDTPAVPY